MCSSVIEVLRPKILYVFIIYLKNFLRSDHHGLFSLVVLIMFGEEYIL